MIKKINFTRKRLSFTPIERNTAEMLEARYQYAIDVSRLPDENLIFLDETGFNEHTRRAYGYSPVQVKAHNTGPANKNTNRSMLCAIKSTGVVAFSYRVGAYNSNYFIDFIREKLVPFFEENLNKILIMDNARIHKSVEVQNFLRVHNITVKFLPPYSPQLNPIEEFFSMFKSKFKAIKAVQSNLDIGLIIEQIFRTNVFYNSCLGFYRHMRSWLEKAIRKEPFI